VRDVGLWAVQDGFDLLHKLESVEIRYHLYEQCHKIIIAPESISELRNWRNQQVPSDGVYLHRAGVAILEDMALPKHGTRFTTPFIDHIIKKLDLEREYRRAVVAQQTTAGNAVKWLADSLPVGNV
jgi:hypothetical protein